LPTFNKYLNKLIPSSSSIELHNCSVNILDSFVGSLYDKFAINIIQCSSACKLSACRSFTGTS